MKVTVAMDSFKGSLTSMEAGQAVAEGVRRACPGAEILLSPLADGGEGTVEALTLGLGGELVSRTVTGPLGESVSARYGLLSDGITAVLEMASAAGLPLVPAHRRDPLHATTCGVGELIADTLDRGCRRFIVGIGGSATNDGGVGMLAALGYRFLDREGNPIPPGAVGLEQLARIDASNRRPELADCRFRIACDVDSPLCGPLGSSAVFGPQKGATPEMVERLDALLARYARITREGNAAADPDLPGAGAAGGLGFGFLAHLNGELVSGAQLVLEETGLEQRMAGSDLVITGEGRIDSQTALGKAPHAVAVLAGRLGCPAVGLGGMLTQDARPGELAAIFPILRRPCTLGEAMDPASARQNLADTAEQLCRLWQAARRR